VPLEGSVKYSGSVRPTEQQCVSWSLAHWGRARAHVKNWLIVQRPSLSLRQQRDAARVSVSATTTARVCACLLLRVRARVCPGAGGDPGIAKISKCRSFSVTS
jgi:hypothetical protein